MEKQLVWANKLGGVEPLWTSKVDHTVLARLMESQIWHQSTGSVGEGLRKGAMASACLDAGHFSSSLCATGAFQAATPVLELRGSKSGKVSPCVCSLRGTAWSSRSFFHQLNPCLLLQPEVVGTCLPGTGTLGLEAWCGAGTPRS